MCKCTPNCRTPFCGRPGCEWPGQTTQASESSKQKLEAAVVERSRVGLLEEALRRIYSGAKSLEVREENPVECAQAIQQLCDDALRGWDLSRPTWIRSEYPPSPVVETSEVQRLRDGLRKLIQECGNCGGQGSEDVAGEVCIGCADLRKLIDEQTNYRALKGSG